MKIRTEKLFITAAFFLIVVIALLIPGIKVVFGLIGATVSNIIAFILPGAFFLKSCKLDESGGSGIKDKRFLEIASWFLIAFGFISMIICTYANLV